MNLSVDTFCSSPWAEVRVNSDGTMNFCHYANKDGIGADENIHTMSVDQYFNDSQSVNQTRKDLLQGHKIDRCQRCYHQEKLSPVTFRSRRNLQFGIFPGQDLIPSFHESTMAETVKKSHINPRFYHISFSNLCNLACPMCTPHDSSALAQDLKRAGMIDKSWPILRDWTDAGPWNSFCQHLVDNPEIVCLHIMGGEPFYHKKFLQLLDFLIEKNHTDFVLTLVSNGTIINDELINKLKRFKSVQIEISIEALDSVNDYLRYPSTVSETLSNIHQFLKHRDDRFDIVIRTVPQIFSVYNYDQLLQWCLDHRVAIDSNLLFNPVFFRPRLLPQEIKQEIIDRLSRFAAKTNISTINIRNIDQGRNDIQQNAATVIAAINEKSDDPDRDWKDLVEYCRRLDRVRNLDLKTYVPWLAKTLEQYGY